MVCYYVAFHVNAVVMVANGIWKMVLRNNSSYDVIHPVSSLVELLRFRASHQPDKRAYTFLSDTVTEEEHLTYRQLDERAQAIGARLQDLGLMGERVLLLYPPGLDYISAFFGCLFAGAVAVPAYPPDPARLQRTLPRFQALTDDSQVKAILTTAPIFAMTEFVFDAAPDLRALHWLVTDNIVGGSAEQWQDPGVGIESLAFLQYTSGSTAVPKGVMLSHGNLLHNSTLIQRCFEHTEESCGVIWLPPYHDMGLIGGIIQPLYVGFPVILMSPLDFLKNPLGWLQAITRYQATTSGGPNFAYDLCVRKITTEQRARLDLSSWQVAFNGAEPINPQTIVDFTGAFAVCGFKPEAFYPCYGLAEATLIVSGGLKVERPILKTFAKEALEHNQVQEATTDVTPHHFVSCGRSMTGQTIIIVDPETGRLRPTGQVGEIWVSGASISQGYWNRPDATNDTFYAYLAETGEGPFLRTGDLGFLQEGELFITGRLKDLIIIRGRNYYPHDIEQAVEQCHELLRPGCSAAFSLDVAGQEQLIIISEIRHRFQDSDLNGIIETVRRIVAELFQLQAHIVVLIKAGTLPKTSSGKVQRFACRSEYLAGDLDVIQIDELSDNDTRPREASSFIRRALDALTESHARQALLTLYLQEQIARVLRVSSSKVDVRQVFSNMGLDPLMSTDLLSNLETDLGIQLPIHSFLQDLSCEQLAVYILSEEHSLLARESSTTLEAGKT